MKNKELNDLFKKDCQKYKDIRGATPNTAYVSAKMYIALRYSFMTPDYGGDIHLGEDGALYCHDTEIVINDKLKHHQVILE